MPDTLLRFTKANRKTGVDGHFKFGDPRVLLNVDDIPAPLHPEDGGYWEEFGATIEAVCQAHDRARMTRGVPKHLEAITRGQARGAAELVHKDWPSDIMVMTAKAMPQDSELRVFAGKRRDFTDGLVLVNELIAWAARLVSPTSFAFKWEHMAARPEEVAGAIARDEIDAPDHIRSRLFDTVSREILVKDQRKFTVFPEGSPNHPSMIAMHAAAAGAGHTVNRVMYDMGFEGRETNTLAAYRMATFRSTAGVHNPQDNIGGLQSGTKILEKALPKKLNEVLGIPVKNTEKILADTQVQWA